MLIKITRAGDHPRNFVLFDNATAVECICPIHFDDSKGLYQWMSEQSRLADEIHRVVDPRLSEPGKPFWEDSVIERFPLSRQRRYSISAVNFRRDGKHWCVFFDGEAFICNDEGRTLERIIAGGLYEDELTESAA